MRFCIMTRFFFNTHLIAFPWLTAHSRMSSTHCVNEDSTARNWSHSSAEMNTFRLALIQVTINVWNGKHSHDCDSDRTIISQGCTCRIYLGKIILYLDFLSFLDTNIKQVVEIFSYGRQGPIYPEYSIAWQLMTWWSKEPGHQQPCYWLFQPEYSCLGTRRVEMNVWQLKCSTLSFVIEMSISSTVLTTDTPLSLSGRVSYAYHQTSNIKSHLRQ